MNSVRIFRIASTVLVAAFAVITTFFVVYLSTSVKGYNEIITYKEHEINLAAGYFFLIFMVLSVLLLYFLFYRFSIVFIDSHAKLREEMKVELRTHGKKVEEEKREKEIEIEEREQKAGIEKKIAALSSIETENITVEDFLEKVLQNFGTVLNSVQGLAYKLNEKEEAFKLVSTFAFFSEDKKESFKLDEGIPGQVALSKEYLVVNNVPSGYVKVLSGLGDGDPNSLVVMPLVVNGQTQIILEMAFFQKINEDYEYIINKGVERITESYSALFAAS